MTSYSEVLSITWVLVSFILDVLGNGYVIIAARSFNAIKLDKLSVWIVLLLAIADIGNGITILLPVLIVLFEGWTFGDAFCKISFIYKYTFTVANIILINFFSLNKLYRCLVPLATHQTGKEKRIVTIATVLGSLILPMYMVYSTLLSDSMQVIFSPAQCMCWGDYTPQAKPMDKVVGYVLASMLNAIPCALLVATNTFLTVFAFVKAKSSVNKMNIAIVIVVTGLFLLSMLPYFVYYMILGDNWSDTASVRFMTFAMFLSSFCNPIVYFLTNKRFRQFTVRLIKLGPTRVAVTSNTVSDGKVTKTKDAIRIKVISSSNVT